jgi:hypothetical protein
MIFCTFYQHNCNKFKYQQMHEHRKVRLQKLQETQKKPEVITLLCYSFLTYVHKHYLHHNMLIQIHKFQDRQNNQQLKVLKEIK